MGIEIEDGIPVPPPAGRASKYPWEALEQRDLFDEIIEAIGVKR